MKTKFLILLTVLLTINLLAGCGSRGIDCRLARPGDEIDSGSFCGDNYDLSYLLSRENGSFLHLQIRNDGDGTVVLYQGNGEPLEIQPGDTGSILVELPARAADVTCSVRAKIPGQTIDFSWTATVTVPETARPS